MPFPFLPFGALLAVAVLGGAFAAFAIALRLLDRSALTARRSIAAGIAAGLRGWSDAGQPAGGSGPVGDELIDEIAPDDRVQLERVRLR